MTSKSARAGMALLVMLALMGLGIASGLSFDTTYRILCAVGCLLFIASLGVDYPGASWPWVGFGAAALINAGLFLTPIFDHPSSRGEIILFALPDAIAVLTARLAYFPVNTDHDRAQRQFVIFGLVVSVVLCGVLYSLALISH